MNSNYFKVVLMLMVVFLLCFSAACSIGTMTSESDNFKKKHIELITNEENPLEVYLEPGLFSRGVKITFSNIGDTTLTNIGWCFSTKPVTMALLGKGDVCSQTLDELQAGEETTIVLRPFFGDFPSPRGFGRVYMKIQAQADGFDIVKDQKQAFLLFCVAYDMKDTYIDIPPEEAYSMVMNETFDLIIDVVGLDIYSLGHLPGAVNYVWADGTLEEMIPTLDVNGTYLVYCHTDPPSTDSAQKIVDAGISSVYRLEGNYRAWVEAGYPVET